MNSKNLLWKTCRVLANETRLRILQRLMRGAELCVSDVADAEKLSAVVASQHLRLLHDSGFLHLTRKSKWVFYRAEVNPAVPYAKIIYSPLKTALVFENTQIKTIFRIFTAFTHPRRIELTNVLSKRESSFENLLASCDISGMALHRHLKKLISRKFIAQKNDIYQLLRQTNRLQSALLNACLSSGPYHTS